MRPLPSLWLRNTIATCLFFFITPCSAQYLLTDTTIVHRLDSHVKVFIDSSNNVTFDQILRPELQRSFRTSTGNLTFGYLKSPIWLELQTRTNSLHTTWYLEIPAPFLEYVDFYQRDSLNNWRHSVSGYYRRHSEREVSHTGHVLPIKFEENSISTVYIRIGGTSPKTFPLYAIEEDKFIAKTRMEDLGYGIFFGILIVMFFYNLFIYLTLRQRNYLYYCCTIVCTFLLLSSISGYGGKFLWPETPTLNYYYGKLSLEVLIIFLTIFTIRFLELRTYSRLLYYLLMAMIPLSVIAFVMVMTQLFPFAGNSLVLVATLLFMATGIVVRIQGNKTATYFIAAWTIYLFGGMLIALRNSGLLDFNFWTTHFVEIGAVLETTILGFALGAQYRQYKKEKEEAQMLALKIQQEATSKLELKVKERTEELSKANEHLQLTLETNKLQTEIIEHKNAELDSFFYRISHDLKGPISSALGVTMLAQLDVKDKVALEYFQKQQTQLERLSKIIKGLVKLTKLNDEDLQIKLIDLDRMISECILSFNSFANFHKVKFRRDIDPDIEFYSEWTLLNGIIQNLIENSIKYASEEDPYVHIRVRRESEWIVIEVEDNGQGIPAEHQDRIFEMFFRATENEGGTGLGLYILKRSVDRLKGTIEIKSEVGVGSTFSVRLPSMRPARALAGSPVNYQ